MRKTPLLKVEQKQSQHQALSGGSLNSPPLVICYPGTKPKTATGIYGTACKPLHSFHKSALILWILNRSHKLPSESLEIKDKATSLILFSSICMCSVQDKYDNGDLKGHGNQAARTVLAMICRSVYSHQRQPHAAMHQPFSYHQHPYNCLLSS